MAAYVGRDVSKLKNKGGKWKYVPPSFPLFTSYCPRSRETYLRVRLHFDNGRIDAACGYLVPDGLYYQAVMHEGILAED